MSSTSLYNVSTAGYVLGLALFAFHVINVRQLILRIGIVVVALSFLVQTGGMLLRWIEAGFLEVNAAERAIGQTLTGWSWFIVFTQHPPWSNLYEIMVYMAWGIILATLAAEMKWHLPWIRQAGIILALVALGMAALTDSVIKPLVPALKSWWIMIHVISASVAYAAGSIAAFICLFALLKDERVDKEKFLGCAAIFLSGLLLALGGGSHLLFEQAFLVKPLAMVGEAVVSVRDMSHNGGISFSVPMPFMGVLLISSIALHFLFGIIIFLKKQSKKTCDILFALCFFSSFICLAVMISQDIRQTSIVINGPIAHHLMPEGPWFIGFKSHPWSLGLLVCTVMIEGILLLNILRPNLISSIMPPVDILEAISYKTISLTFFLMTVVLVTGALWAHYAWGRYWAWDPKETGALAIWLNYAIYLHARRTPGFNGPVSSVIGVMGFFIIILGFLGVNLGLFADGLHTYGND